MPLLPSLQLVRVLHHTAGLVSLVVSENYWISLLNGRRGRKRLSQVVYSSLADVWLRTAVQPLLCLLESPCHSHPLTVISDRFVVAYSWLGLPLPWNSSLAYYLRKCLGPLEKFDPFPCFSRASISWTNGLVRRTLCKDRFPFFLSWRLSGSRVLETNFGCLACWCVPGGAPAFLSLVASFWPSW